MEGLQVQSIVSHVFKIILALFAVITLIRLEYVWFIGILFALILTLLPTILAKDFNIKLPIIFDAALTVSVFFHVFGEYADLYDIIPYYDHFTHSMSSATVSLIGVTLLYILVFTIKVTQLPPLFFGLFSVLFAMSMGVIWEFLEWGFDYAFGSDLQRGLNNTMWDLIFDSLAGLVIGAFATINLRYSKSHQIPDLYVGEITKSLGYKRWKQLTDKDKNLREKMRIAFKDPIVLEGVFDYVVKEYKYITKSEEKAWKAVKETCLPEPKKEVPKKKNPN
jgi:hypothetical protein